MSLMEHPELAAAMVAAAVFMFKIGSKIVDTFWDRKVLRTPSNGTYLRAIEKVVEAIEMHDTSEKEHSEKVREAIASHHASTQELLGRIAETQASLASVLNLLANQAMTQGGTGSRRR